jgi:hypothetical protein
MDALDDEFSEVEGYPGMNGSTEEWQEFFESNPGAQVDAYNVLVYSTTFNGTYHAWRAFL